MEEKETENLTKEKVNDNVGNEKVKRQEGKKKSKKGVKIALVILLIVAVIVIGGFLFFNYHKQQLEILAQEMNKITGIEISNSDGNVNEDAKIDMEIKSKGNYAVVEQTFKDYLNETLELSQDVYNIYDSEKIEKILSIENMKEDGPDFTKTKDTIAQMKGNSDNYINKFVELCNEQNLLGAIDDKPVNDYYKEIYKNLMVDENASKELQEVATELESARTKINGVFDGLNNIMTFLSENKSDWTIEDNQILFYSQSKLEQYNKIVSELQMQ